MLLHRRSVADLLFHDSRILHGDGSRECCSDFGDSLTAYVDLQRDPVFVVYDRHFYWPEGLLVRDDSQ